jgi:hypothetical protein
MDVPTISKVVCSRRRSFGVAVCQMLVLEQVGADDFALE